MAGLKNNFNPGESFPATAANAIATAVSELNQAGPYASRPTATFPGRRYDCTDTDLVLQDNGSSWDIVSPANFTAPPAMSWTTTTLGSATFAGDKGDRLLTCPSAAGLNMRAEYRTLSPTSNYTFTACIESAAVSNVDFVRSGIVLRDSGGQLITFGHSGGASERSCVTAVKWTSPTVATAVYLSVSTLDMQGRPNWFRIRDNGTNRFFEYSINGVDFLPFTSSTRTDFLTPTQIGWGATNSTGTIAYHRLRSFGVV